MNSGSPEQRRGALAQYQEVVVGARGLGPLLRYEILHGLLGPLPGAVGLLLRSRLYGGLLGRAGRGMIIGRSVTLRGPSRIYLADKVVLDEQVEISVRGDQGRVNIGAGTHVSRGTIMHTRDGLIDIGPESSLGTNCRLGTTGKITIGRYGLFAAGCYIGGEDHPADDPSIPMVKRPAVSRGGVTMGEDVWLGFRATVLDGVTIGDGAIIGAGSLVTKDIPALAVAVGTPAKVVRYREKVSTAGGEGQPEGGDPDPKKGMP
jgi:acetyltransferase-like isoleucine patch superfamily enzyme